MSRGGVWILLVNRPEMKTLLCELEHEKGISIHAIECNTVNDAEKAGLLIEAFNEWTVEGIREFMKWQKSFSKL